MPNLAFSTAFIQRQADWAAAHLLPDTCAVQREVNSVYTTVTGMSAVPCALIDNQPPTEKDISDETTGAVMKTVLFPRGTDVRNPDQLVINSIKYRVFDVPDPGTYEVLRRVTVVRFPQRGAVS